VLLTRHAATRGPFSRRREGICSAPRTGLLLNPDQGIYRRRCGTKGGARHERVRVSKYVVLRANAVALLVLIGLLVLAGGATWEMSEAAHRAAAWTQHTGQVINTIKELDLAARRAESGQRGFLLTGDEDYLRPYQAALGRVSLLQGELQHLTADNPAQQERLRALAPILQRKLEELAQSIQLRRTEGLDKALAIVRSDVGRELMQEIEVILTAMTEEEEQLLRVRIEASDRRGEWVGITALTGTLLGVIAVAWAIRLLNRSWNRSYASEAEQRVLAQQLRTTLDSLSQGIGVFAPDRTLVNWNECFQQLLHLPKPLLRVGTPYNAFVEHTTVDGQPLLESDEELRYGPPPGMDAITYERSRPNGHILEARRTATPDGGFVLTISDLTKRAQAEAVLRESQKMQAIGQLTGGIAHDFNNLLTVVLGNLEVGRSRLPQDSPVQRLIERASWAAQRGAALTAQLLAFARRQPLAPVPIDLTETVPDLIPLLRRTLGEHIEIRYVETSGLWPAMADAAQLEAALLNLALNARDAMPGGGRLTIELGNRVLDEAYARAHAEVRPGDYAMLAVSDTGHGMTPETLARVFEPFFTTKPDGKGTGLGLAMVFGFVKQSGGHIKIYSEPGEGTTVRIYLPRAVDGGAGSTRAVAPISLPRGSATILIVEDETAVREITSTMLTELGYRVMEASDGEEALRLFGAHRSTIDLLLTDVVLPGPIRGREIAEQITAMRPAVRVLFMSGYTENSIVHHGRLDDGVKLLGKPFTRDQLARAVADVLTDHEAKKPASESAGEMPGSV